MDGLDTLKAKYLTAVAGAADESALEEVRLAALGKKGEISAMMATLGKMDPDTRKAAGASLNALKDEIDAALRARKSGLADAALDERLRTEWLDVTLPGRPRPRGTIHPITQVTEEITAIFADMGFSIVSIIDKGILVVLTGQVIKNSCLLPYLVRPVCLLHR